MTGGDSISEDDSVMVCVIVTTWDKRPEACKVAQAGSTFLAAAAFWFVHGSVLA